MSQDKYTEKASSIVFFARYESSQAGVEFVEPEHLLLGLLRSDPELIHILNPDKPGEVATIRALVESSMVRSSKIELRTEVSPLSEAAVRVLNLSADMSKNLGQNYIASEHILIGLIEGESLANRILRERGLSAEKIKAQVSGGSITDQELQGSGQGILKAHIE